VEAACELRDFRPWKQTAPDVSKIALATSSYQNGGASQTYYPFAAINAPDGINVTIGTYPATAQIRPISFGNWNPASINTSSIAIAGYRGMVRMLVVRTELFPGSVTPLPSALKWIRTGAAVSDAGKLEFRIGANVAVAGVSTPTLHSSFLFPIDSDGCFFIEGLETVTAPPGVQAVGPQYLSVVIQFDPSSTIESAFTLVKTNRDNLAGSLGNYNNRRIVLPPKAEKALVGVETNPGPGSGSDW
jgi:hypothetical protein